MPFILSRLRFVPLLLAILLSPLTARADLQISVNFAPPELPVYEQPFCPGPGYLWVPGYWAYDPDYGEYYWVPGTWARPPRAGLLWTPGYWAWSGYAYTWNPGYWSTQVGFYGGINYGYGYPGSGFYGGYWRGPHYYYNRSVNRVDTRHIPYVYQRTVVNNITINRISFNGGDGVHYRPSEREREYSRLSRYAPTSPQLQHIQFARQDRQLFARENGGRPPIAATLRPGDFGPRDTMPSRETWRSNDSRRESWQGQNERRPAEPGWQRDAGRDRGEQQGREERERLQDQFLRRNEDDQQRRQLQDRQNWARQQQETQRQQEQMRERDMRQRDDQLREQQRRQLQDRQRAYEQQQRQMQQQREQQQREADQQQERMRREMQQQQERQQRDLQQQQERQRRDLQQQQERQQQERQQRQQPGEQQGRREAPPWARALQRGDNGARD